MSILIVAEHDNNDLNPATLNAVTAASAIGGDIHILVAGHGCVSVAEQASNVAGVSKCSSLMHRPTSMHWQKTFLF